LNVSKQRIDLRIAVLLACNGCITPRMVSWWSWQRRRPRSARLGLAKKNPGSKKSIRDSPIYPQKYIPGTPPSTQSSPLPFR